MQPLQPGHVETGRSVSLPPSPCSGLSLPPFPPPCSSRAFPRLPFLGQAAPQPGTATLSVPAPLRACAHQPLSGLAQLMGRLSPPPPRRRHTRVFDGLAVGAWVCVCSGPYVLRAHCTPHGPILSVRVCSVSPVLRCLLLLPVAVFLVPFQRSFFLGSRRG